MLQSTENTIRYIEDGVLEHKTRLIELNNNILEKPRPFSHSISRTDRRFLQLACLVEKPKKIMEIGTWIGTSAYALSQASDALVYTCDQGPDNFYIIEGQESYTDRIIRHPDTHSSEFLKNIDGGFDFVFADANLDDNDVKDIFKKCEDNFTFITHDYYRPEKPKPVFCKGHHAAMGMLIYAWENGYETEGASELYPPSPDWYREGYHSQVLGFFFKSFNSSCAMIKFEKV
jgi:hypothetical protein